MRRFGIVVALLGLGLPGIASAQPLPDLDPAVWVVKDADTTIYMFGTFHLLDGKSEWFNDEVKTAFDASQEVTLEAILPKNPADMQALVMKYAIDESGKNLSERLSPGVKARLEKEMSAIGLPLAAFERFEPWFVATTLTIAAAQKLGLSGDKGPEAVISTAARASGKAIGELEGMEGQLSFLDSLSDEDQLKFLTQTLESSGKLDEQFPTMIKAWGTADMEKLVALMNESLKDSPRLYKAMFTDRNARWTDWIARRLEKPGTVFMAVGAGHLAGDDGVPALLAKRGLKATRFKG